MFKCYFILHQIKKKLKFVESSETKRINNMRKKTESNRITVTRIFNDQRNYSGNGILSQTCICMHLNFQLLELRINFEINCYRKGATLLGAHKIMYFIL